MTTKNKNSHSYTSSSASSGRVFQLIYGLSPAPILQEGEIREGQHSNPAPRMRTLEGIRYLINLDSAEIQQNFAGGVAPPDKVESEVDTT